MLVEGRLYHPDVGDGTGEHGGDRLEVERAAEVVGLGQMAEPGRELDRADIDESALDLLEQVREISKILLILGAAASERRRQTASSVVASVENRTERSDPRLSRLDSQRSPADMAIV